jgi:hypothetical protein
LQDKESAEDRNPKENAEDRVQTLKVLDTSIRQEIKGLKFQNEDFALDRVKSLIIYTIARVDYYEDYRTRFLGFSATLLGFAVAFATFLYRYVGMNAFLFIATISLIFTCLVNVALYLWHSIYPSYPHRPIAKSPWYYMYNLYRLDKNKSDYSGRSDTKATKWLLDFRDNVKKIAGQTKQEALIEDIEQLVILYIITAYKKKFSEYMQNVLAIGLLLFAFFSILGLFFL